MGSGGPVEIRAAALPDLPAVLALLQEYFREGDVQHTDSPAQVESILASPLPGFLLAFVADQPVGCVLLKPLAHIPSACECKRLYVRPVMRGHGIAARLMDDLESVARQNGYTWMYLDSADNFDIAIAMYRRRGYQPCERYNDNPQATVFFRKHLESA